MKYKVTIWTSSRSGLQCKTGEVYSGNSLLSAIYHLLFTRIYSKEIIQLQKQN